MRIGFYQFEPRLRQRELNVRRITAALARVQADLVVMPEMCITGYLFSSRDELLGYAEPVPDGPSCQRLLEFCRGRNLSVVFGMAEKAGDKLYNSSVLITPAGRVGVYRKTHLFMDEKDVFDPGDCPFPVFEVDSVKVGMLVCFDHFFPEAARALALKGAQIICHPANIVLDYAHTTTTCRCIENRVFWVLANRTGREKAGEKELRFIGRSRIVAPGGRLLYQAGADTEELPVIEIDPKEALDKHVTPRNDLLQDRRTDLYS
jgi:predicted amidohydrolase